ncbi:hypothetical protein K7I13_13985 [Brucepastera parasyntrophica]|uniref:hypothetical protein n=1 Tax=Brucepastera parasyntrophica TaxID=2880008 RepID=UPI00210E5F48|nr:hypothetical protein [Brucepastera parasyntrophica]ULQ59557.1 hypothetical protein K7I13_13985 [Brucepastera parasyntrophica]
MTENCTYNFKSFFLHGNQTSGLENEQRFLRRIFHRRKKNADLPFNFLPPFCLFENCRISGEIPVIGVPEEKDGWIVRPISGVEGQAGKLPAFPGYPPLPGPPCFILGYAGDAAGQVIGEFRGHCEDGQPFSIRIWYTADLSVSVTWEHGSAYSVLYSIGPEKWHKADRD